MDRETPKFLLPWGKSGLRISAPTLVLFVTLYTTFVIFLSLGLSLGWVSHRLVGLIFGGIVAFMASIAGIAYVAVTILERTAPIRLASTAFYLGAASAVAGLASWIFGLIRAAYVAELSGAAAFAIGAVLCAVALLWGEAIVASRTDGALGGRDDFLR